MGHRHPRRTAQKKGFNDIKCRMFVCVMRFDPFTKLKGWGLPEGCERARQLHIDRLSPPCTRCSGMQDFREVFMAALPAALEESEGALGRTPAMELRRR
jgi:hypothetical protein